MAVHLSRLFWGLLLVNLDISINGFDFLPDGVGYLIVAAGCRGLTPQSTSFDAARTLCLISGLLWLLGLLVDKKFAVPCVLMTTVANCAMIWHLLGGVAEFAISRQRRDLADQAGNRRVIYVAITAGASLLGLSLQGSRDAGPLAIVLIIGMLVLIAMILQLIHRVRVELAT